MAKSLKPILILLFSVSSLAAAGYGIYRALHSPLFLVRVVEVEDQPPEAPVDAATLHSLADVPVGNENLFDLALEPIEKRILTNSWIREVHLTKRFPQTLSIAVVFRTPVALFQHKGGLVSYVDQNGKVFGKVNLLKQPDLPVLSGFGEGSEARIAKALRIIEAWREAELDASSQIAGISFEEDRGFRVLTVYPLIGDGGMERAQQKGRAMVDFGLELVDSAESELVTQLSRLKNVFIYLSSNGVAARQIWADAGKKIVVKVARGS